MNDYTKGNSRFWRFATLHWNRSHTHQITAILELIKNGTINNHQDFFSALDRITLVNEKGALACRLSFLKHKFAQTQADSNIDMNTAVNIPGP